MNKQRTSAISHPVCNDYYRHLNATAFRTHCSVYIKHSKHHYWVLSASSSYTLLIRSSAVGTADKNQASVFTLEDKDFLLITTCLILNVVALV